MDHQYRITTPHLILSPLTQTDIEQLRLLRNRDDNRKWFFDDTVITKEMQTAWYAKYQKAKNDVMFRIGLLDCPNDYVGSIAIIGDKNKHGKAEIARLLLDSKRLPIRGLAAEAIYGACSIAFCEMGYELLFSQVFSDNARSLDKFSAVGFQKTHHEELHGKEIVTLQLKKEEFLHGSEWRQAK